jgi:hypothetical protein
MIRASKNRRAVTQALALSAFFVALGPAWAQRELQGEWVTRPETMPIDTSPNPVNPVHAALLRTGKVLVIAGSGNDPSEDVYRAAVWDPATGAIAVQTIDWDIWCSGMAFLPDGKVFIAGGTINYEPTFTGARFTTLYDPFNSTFTRVEDMAHGRWYPTVIALPDGRMLTLSGYNDTTGAQNKTFAIYTPGTQWSAENGVGWPSTMKNYPRGHLTPDGKVFFSGEQRESARFDPDTGAWTRNVAITQFGSTRRYGGSVLLGLRPPDYKARILINGGGVTGDAANTAEIIDLSAPNPDWQYTDALSYRRVQHNSVLLPNGKVLAVGGSGRNEVAQGNARTSELYTEGPGVTGVWSLMDSQEYWRLYHSVALLLPDGRVVSMGGNPAQRNYEHHIEVYSPPYLYTSGGGLAARPAVSSVPDSIAYNGTFDVTMTSPGAITEAVLMRPGAATHAFDMEQRLVELVIRGVVDGKLRLETPPNANIAPPGYYMLFVLNAAGVPSEAKFVRLPVPGAPPPPPPPPSGNLLTNPGLEAGATAWTGATGRIVSSPVHGGAQALRVQASSSAAIVVKQEKPVLPGARYTALAWVKTDAYAAGGLVQAQWLNSGGSVVSTVTIGKVAGTQPWTNVATNVTAPATAAKLRFKLIGPTETDGAGTAYFDDLGLNPQ